MNNWVSNNGVSNNGVSNNGVCNDWVDWCWWVCHSLVFDISNVTPIASSISVVVNDLDAAIGQSHPVVSSHRCTIGSLALAKVGTRVLILNTILESIRLGWLNVSMSRGMDWGMDDGSSMNNGCCMDNGSRVHNGSWVNWGRMENWCWVEGGGAGSGHGSKENSGLGEHFWKLGCCWLSVKLLDCN